MIQQARPARAAGTHALVAAIERSQILLLRPPPRALIPYKDEEDIAVLEWIVSHVRRVRQSPAGSCRSTTTADRKYRADVRLGAAAGD